MKEFDQKTGLIRRDREGMLVGISTTCFYTSTIENDDNSHPILRNPATPALPESEPIFLQRPFAMRAKPIAGEWVERQIGLARGCIIFKTDDKFSNVTEDRSFRMRVGYYEVV